MHDSRHLCPRGRSDGEHGPSTALREERLLQRLPYPGGAGDAGELLAHACTAVPELAAQCAQPR